MRALINSRAVEISNSGAAHLVTSKITSVGQWVVVNGTLANEIGYRAGMAGVWREIPLQARDGPVHV